MGGHGNGIKWYRHIELPGDGITAASACLQVDPARPPGTPDEFYTAATRLAQRGQAIRDVLAQLDSIARNDCVWQGDAAEAFRKVLRDAHQSNYDQVPVRYDGYAQALRQYGSTLYGHQATIDGARADVQAALDAYRRAQQVTPPKVAPDCPPFPAQVHLPSPSCDAVVDDCRAAARRFQIAYNDWVDAVTTCEHAIERVDDDKLHNAHGAAAARHEINQVVHAAVDLTAKLADVVATVSAVLAVLTLWNPLLAGALLELSTVASATALAADVLRKTAYGEDVSLTDLAFDALGCVPGAKPTVEGVAAARGLRGARLLTKLRTGARVFQKTFAEDVVPSLGKAMRRLLRKDSWRVTTQGMGRFFVVEWDVVTNGPPVARDAFDNRKNGWLPALEGASLGPLAPLVERTVRTVKNELPRPAFGR